MDYNLERAFPLFEPLGIFKIVVISFIFNHLLFMIFLHMCDSVRCVTFTTNLTLFRRNKTISTLPQSLMTPLMALLSLLLFGLLSVESPENYLPLIFILPKLDYGHMFSLALKCRKFVFQILFAIISIYILYLETTSSACILCLLVFQNWCYSFTQNGSRWIQMMFIRIPALPFITVSSIYVL